MAVTVTIDHEARAAMPVLSNPELRMIAEVVTELAKYRGTAFDKTSKGTTFARAALIDPAFKARLVEIHRRLEAWRTTDMLAPVLRNIILTTFCLSHSAGAGVSLAWVFGASCMGRVGPSQAVESNFEHAREAPIFGFRVQLLWQFFSPKC